MTKEVIETAAKAILDRIALLHKMTDLLMSFRYIEQCPVKLGVDVWGGDIDLHITNMRELHKVRKYLRKEFGRWKDRLINIWHSGTAHAMWRGEIKGFDGINVNIWLVCPIEKFPKELQKDGCGFREVQKTEIRYVCNKEQI